MAKNYEDMNARELRDEAKKLGVAGYSGMKKSELLEAVTTVGGETKPKKSKATKKTSKKAAPKATKAAKAPKAKKEKDPDNPFRADTNLWHITEALKQGGPRQELIDELKGTLSFKPRKQTKKEFDVETEIDRRLKVVAYILKDEYNWDFSHEGRGRTAVIKVTPAA